MHELFRIQHGVATRAQLLAAGLTAATIRYLVTTGVLIPVHRGVYRHAAAPQTDEQRLMAACLACGPDAFASHRAAAWVWGLDVGLVLDVTLPHGRNPRPAGVVVHRSRGAGRTRPVRRRRIPVSDPFLTLLDLGTVEPLEVVDDALTIALSRRLVTFVGCAPRSTG